MLERLIYLSLAGIAGTLCRYGLQGLVQKWAGSSFPWGTCAVNALGCFIFGVVWSLGGERAVLTAETRNIVLIGFLGAFTTFSTFAAESGRLLAGTEWALAAGNILLQNVSGIALFLAGQALGRWV
jgi:fluoride exporter